MVSDIESRELSRSSRTAQRVSLLLPLLLLLLLAACGTPPPSKHPLSQVDITPTDAANSTVTTGNGHVSPIQLLSSQSHLSTYPGGQMSMAVSTSPYALCSFSVSYGRSMPSANVGVVPHTADANGMVNWTWRVDQDAHTGTWPLTITASLAGSGRITQTVQVSVVLPPITVVSSTLTAYPRQTMTLTISTAPNVQCTLGLYEGVGKPMKYLKNVTDTNGVATWTWHVANASVAGVWQLPIVVTLVDGEQVNSQVTMTIM